MITYRDGNGDALDGDAEAVALPIDSRFSIEWDAGEKVSVRRTSTDEWLALRADGPQKVIARVGYMFDPRTDYHSLQETLSAAVYRALFP